MEPAMLNDGMIRQSLRRGLDRQAARCRRAVVIEEFSIARGSARVDLALVNGHLRAYEIKSDRDTLLRLPAQTAHYNRIFDRIVLIVGWRHALAAMRSVPQWWGIRLTESGPKGGIRFSVLRDSAPNPMQDSKAVAGLLWRAEAVSILKSSCGWMPPAGVSRLHLAQAIADGLSTDRVRQVVCQAIKGRYS